MHRFDAGSNGSNGSPGSTQAPAPAGHGPPQDGGNPRVPARRRDPFAPDSIVVDPQVPNGVRDELRRREAGTRPGRPPSDQAPVPAADPVRGELVSFRDERPQVPRPPRSRAVPARIAWAAAAVGVISVIAGIAAGPAVFGALFLIGLAAAFLARAAFSAAAQGRPALAGGLIPLRPAGDLTEYHLRYAGRVFHRRYVCPPADFDAEARAAWQRAVDAANRIYRARCLRDRIVDADRVRAEVPELLWKIAEGLAKISDVRFDLRRITRGAQRFHPVVEAKMLEQERLLARGTSQVSRRIERLEALAGRLQDADNARRDEIVLQRLNEVDPKLRDLVASTGESSGEIDMAEDLKLDAEALVEMTNQAINDLSAAVEEEDQLGSAGLVRDDPEGESGA